MATPEGAAISRQSCRKGLSNMNAFTELLETLEDYGKWLRRCPLAQLTDLYEVETLEGRQAFIVMIETEVRCRGLSEILPNRA